MYGVFDPPHDIGAEVGVEVISSSKFNLLYGSLLFSHTLFVSGNIMSSTNIWMLKQNNLLSGTVPKS